MRNVVFVNNALAGYILSLQTLVLLFVDFLFEYVNNVQCLFIFPYHTDCVHFLSCRCNRDFDLLCINGGVLVAILANLLILKFNSTLHAKNIGKQICCNHHNGLACCAHSHIRFLLILFFFKALILFSFCTAKQKSKHF